jgi:hypothetical protein
MTRRLAAAVLAAVLTAAALAGCGGGGGAACRAAVAQVLHEYVQTGNGVVLSRDVPPLSTACRGVPDSVLAQYGRDAGYGSSSP